MTIKERLVRRAPEDVIHIGDLVERVYGTEFGEVIRALINGLITKELSIKETQYGEGRILGRCEGYQALLNNLEQMIDDAKRLKAPVQDEDDDEIY